MLLSFFGSPGVLVLLATLAASAFLPSRVAKFGAVIIATALVKFEPGLDVAALAFFTAGCVGVVVQEYMPLERWIALLLSCIASLATLSLLLTLL